MSPPGATVSCGSTETTLEVKKAVEFGDDADNVRYDRRTDDVFYDSSRHLVYMIGGEGAVQVFSQRDPEHYESVGKELTAPGARTGLFAPSANHLYVAVPHRGSQTAKILVYTPAR